MLEEWKPLNNRLTYHISNKGRIYDLVKRQLVEPAILDGVLTVVIMGDYEPLTYEVQKLVSAHFEEENEPDELIQREPYVKITSTSNPTTMVVLSLDELEHWSKSHDISLDAIERVLNGRLNSAMGYEFNYV